MGCLHFRAPSAVSEHQSGHRTAVAVSLAHLAAERDVPVLAPCETFQNRTLKHRRLIGHLRSLRIVSCLLLPLEVFRKPQSHDPSEILVRETPYRELHGPTFLRRSIWLRECLFQWTAVDQPWNFRIERQEAARLTHGEEATLNSGLRDHLLDLCNREISTRASLHWLIVNDPVAHGFLDSLEIAARKVVNDVRFVVVNRVCLV